MLVGQLGQRFEQGGMSEINSAGANATRTIANGSGRGTRDQLAQCPTMSSSAQPVHPTSFRLAREKLLVPRSVQSHTVFTLPRRCLLDKGSGRSPEEQVLIGHRGDTTETDSSAPRGDRALLACAQLPGPPTIKATR